MSIDKNNIRYPSNVTDKIKYKEYLEYKEYLDNHKNRYFIHKGVKYDLLYSENTLSKQRLENKLPNEEWLLLKQQKKQFLLPIKKLNQLRIESTLPLSKMDKRSYDEVKNEDRFGLNLSVWKRKTEILELYGKFFKTSDIYQIITREWEEEVDIKNLEAFYKGNIEEITQLQQKFENSVQEVRLGKKRSRLDELSWLYSRIKDKFLLYEARDDAKLLTQLLEQIKKEVEGDLIINGKLHVEIEHNIHLQVQTQMLKDFNISAFIVSKLAARLGINPLFIISRLGNSVYNKFNGFGNSSRDQMLNDDIYYPSQMVYDWDRIEQLGKEKMEEDKKLQSLPNIEDIEFEEVKSIRDKILKELENKKQQLSESNLEIKKYQQI